jgi:hypothetical protein
MPRFRFKDTPNGCVGAIDIDTAAPGRVTVAAIGDDRADALAKASLIAEHIAQDPILSALMPPQALVAIKAAKGLSAAAKRGTRTLKRFWGRLRGPGKRRLAAALHDDAKVADLELGFVHPDEVGWGVRSLFKRKRKKKRARMMRRPREREEDDDEQQDDADDGGGDEQQQAAVSDVADDVSDVDVSDDGGEA